MAALTEEQLQGMLTELEDGAFMILEEGDLEFIQGAKMTVDMGFPLTPADMDRVARIYDKFKKIQHDTMGIG